MRALIAPLILVSSLYAIGPERPAYRPEPVRGPEVLLPGRSQRYERTLFPWQVLHESERLSLRMRRFSFYEVPSVRDGRRFAPGYGTGIELDLRRLPSGISRHIRTRQ